MKLVFPEGRMVGQEEMRDELPERVENYSPVTVTLTETTGLLAMSIIALILLVALLRSQRRIQELQEQSGQQ
jgi:Ni/Fe-hydrogenase subunit HybB-like protein